MNPTRRKRHWLALSTVSALLLLAALAIAGMDQPGFSTRKPAHKGVDLRPEDQQSVQAAINEIRNAGQGTNADALQDKMDHGKINREASPSANKDYYASAVQSRGGRMNIGRRRLNRANNSKPGGTEALASTLIHELTHCQGGDETAALTAQANKACELLAQADSEDDKRFLCSLIREKNKQLKGDGKEPVGCSGCDNYGGDGSGSPTDPSPVPAYYDPKYGVYLPLEDDNRDPEYYFSIHGGNYLYVRYTRPISGTFQERVLGLDFYPTAITGSDLQTVYIAGVDADNWVVLKRIRIILGEVPLVQFPQTVLRTSQIQAVVDMDAAFQLGETRLVLLDGPAAKMFFFDLSTGNLSVFTDGVQIPALIGRRSFLYAAVTDTERDYMLENRFAYEDFIMDDDSILELVDLGNDGTVDSWQTFTGLEYTQ